MTTASSARASPGKLNKPFRSLANGLEVNFLREWNIEQAMTFHPYCLVGRNGSGKSNLLEALAAIFYHIECLHLKNVPEKFRTVEAEGTDRIDGYYDPKVCTPDAFELEYLIVPPIDLFDSTMLKELNEKHIKDYYFARSSITKKTEESPEIRCLNIESLNEDDGTVSNNRLPKLLPKFIIGYSSGLNETLSLPFNKMRLLNYDEYAQIVSKDDHYSERPEGRMMFLDEQYTQAIALSLFIFFEDDQLLALKEEIGLTGIRRFRIIIRRFHRIKHSLARWMVSAEGRDSDHPLYGTDELTCKLQGYVDEDDEEQLRLIDRLIKCATCTYEDDEPYEDGEVPATYDDLNAFSPELKTELKKFCTDLFSSVINLSTVKETLGCFKEHYIEFSQINNEEKCPYCGFSDLAGEYNERREAYDHYLPKSKYPFNSVNFRNLAPMCNKCNSSYKLAKDPISNLEGTRRKAFYTFTQNHPDIDFNLTLNCDSLDVLKPDHITIQISCCGYEEQIETWKEVFGIDERYRIKCCGKNDGKAWLARITDECQNYDRSPSEMLESELQTARNQKMADANFLKAPFLEACNRAGLIKDRP